MKKSTQEHLYVYIKYKNGGLSKLIENSWNKKKINKEYGPRTTEKYFNFQMMDNELDEPVYKQVS